MPVRPRRTCRLVPGNHRRPRSAWEVTLEDPPHGGFDWTVLVAKGMAGDGVGPFYAIAQSVFVYFEEVTATPRFDPEIYEQAPAELGMPSPLIAEREGLRDADPVREGDRVSLTLHVVGEDDCPLAVEVTFLAHGRLLSIEKDGTATDRLPLNVQEGRQLLDLSLVGLEDVPAGEWILMIRRYFAGLPRVGIAASGGYCISAAPGVGDVVARSFAVVE